MTTDALRGDFVRPVIRRLLARVRPQVRARREGL